ncbi:MBL fold metallo-hydrolase [Sulfitobacter pontiacus]|jgi:ribonuclease BN (tRNA processing enzyme)|uniref:MBL fold metallo-hydrolase n=1 Tax=Sulfitobacter pontiacus TaxID=60137 RepID=UPI000E82E175|nr:MBL fold metallo-hydrolase [Sulfitobacter pontiacus]HAR83748.1 MBL fold metallo-hydrolase [Sulfitobacter pontiacus]HJO52837.1 MBL fold metallo-hydrolase [Sulfitobacter pontiacus]|tara:strand:- start:2241 stop:3098 length:858 start_codon:yes stop_codon:yes gene_type:complete
MSDNYVALLGTKGGPAIRPGSSMPTSSLYALNGQKIIVDCGLGVTKGLVDQGMQLKDLSLIIISHLHSDHYLELGPLLHTAWTAGLKTHVDIYGPPGLDMYWKGFCSSVKADIDLRIEDEGRPDMRELITIHAIDAGLVLSRDGVTVSAIRNQHPPLVDTFALSFKTDEVHVVFSGDTAPIKALENFARGADLLIHEAMLESALPALLERVGNGSDKLMAHLLKSHTFAHEAAMTAANAGAKRLALTHLIPSDDPAYDEKDWQEACAGHYNGELIVGHDAIRIEL